MVAISTTLRPLPHALPSDDSTLILHVLEGLKMFLQISSLILTEITCHETYPYTLTKQDPYWIVIAKEDWLLCFRSNTIILNIVKFWAGACPNTAKLFLTVYFKRKAYFQKLVPFYWRQHLSLSLDKKWAESIFWLWPRIFDFCLIFIDIFTLNCVRNFWQKVIVYMFSFIYISLNFH